MGRQVAKVIIVIFVYLFVFERTPLSEAEQEHTNRLAGNDKNLSIPQILPSVLAISLSPSSLSFFLSLSAPPPQRHLQHPLHR